jgi:hypothetical protein
MINFLLWTMPLLGPSMMVVPLIAVVLLIVAWAWSRLHPFRADRFGAWMVSFVVVMLLVWGIWIGAYHLYPVVPVYNNLCDKNEQVMGYCR